jgi:hypothetical protein
VVSYHFNWNQTVANCTPTTYTVLDSGTLGIPDPAIFNLNGLNEFITFTNDVSHVGAYVFNVYSEVKNFTTANTSFTVIITDVCRTLVVITPTVIPD